MRDAVVDKPPGEVHSQKLPHQKRANCVQLPTLGESLTPVYLRRRLPYLQEFSIGNIRRSTYTRRRRKISKYR